MRKCVPGTECARRSDDFADLRRSGTDGLALRIIVSALLIGIIAASTTLYLNGLDRAASTLMH